MKRSILGLVVALVIAPGLAAGTARATQLGVGAIAHWKTMDACAKQAQAAFPDFTPEANAKRDAKLRDCLNANNLPPREPLASPPR
jgi:hypothetical protein